MCNHFLKFISIWWESIHMIKNCFFLQGSDLIWLSGVQVIFFFLIKCDGTSHEVLFFLQGSNFNFLLLSMFLLTFLSICTCCQLAIAQHTGHPASLQVLGKTEYPTRWRLFHSQEGDLILALLHFVPISLSMRTCCFSQHTRHPLHTHIYPTNLKPPPPWVRW